MLDDTKQYLYSDNHHSSLLVILKLYKVCEKRKVVCLLIYQYCLEEAVFCNVGKNYQE